MSFVDGLAFEGGGAFRGLNLAPSSYTLAPGDLQEATNMALVGDHLTVRPGAQGKFSASLAAELFALTPFEDGIVFVSGGKLYRWAQGASSPTEILIGGSSLSLVGASVQTATLLSVAYLVDGSGALRRTDSTAASALTELDRPDSPTGVITHQTLKDLTDLDWEQNYIDGNTDLPATSGDSGTIAPTSTITQADSNFWDATSTEFVPLDFWNVISGEPAFYGNVLTANNTNCVDLDSNHYDSDGPDAVESDLIRFGVRLDGSYGDLAIVEYEAGARDTTATTEVVDLTIKAIDLLGSEIEAWRKTVRSPLLPTDRAIKVREIVDFRNVPDSDDMHGFKVGFSQPHGRNSGAGAGVNRVAVYLPRQELALSKDADNRLTVRQGSVQVWQGLGAAPSGSGQASGLTDPQTTPPGRLLTGGLKIESDITSADWSSLRVIGLEVLPGAGVSQLSIRLGFHVGSEWFYSEVLEIPTGGGWATTDLRGLAGSLTAVDRICVEFLGDVIIDGLQEAGTSTIVRLGELRNVGNLPEGRPVWYKLVEMDQASDATNLLDVVWSDGSASTALIEATAGSRMAQLTLPARKNSGAEWMALYRFGGEYLPQDGGVAQGRLVTLLSWAAADFAFGGDTDKGTAPRIVAFANPYVSWDKTGSTGDAGSILIDNTPDSWLVGAETYLTGREKAPSAPSAIASWDGRLWVAQGADMYASWQITSGATSGIYWSRLQLPESQDPEAGIKGHWERLLLPPGDSIQRLVALEDRLVVLTKKAIFVVVRTSGVPLYAVDRIGDEDIAGPTSPRAVCEVGRDVLWLASDGLRDLASGGLVPIHPELRGAIESASDAQRAAATLSSTPTRTFLRLGDYLYVWHARERGWTRWSVSASMSVIIGASTYLGGSAGQIYELTGTGDKALSGSSVAAIAFSVKSRLWGRDGKTATPRFILISLVSGGAINLTVAVEGDLTATYTQAIPAAKARWRKRISRATEGARFAVALSGSTSASLVIEGYGLETSQRRQLDD